MSYLIAGGSLVLIALVLLDAFEAMLLPRRITHHFPVRPPLLHLLLDAVGGPGAAPALAQAAQLLPQLLRSGSSSASPCSNGRSARHCTPRGKTSASPSTSI